MCDFLTLAPEFYSNSPFLFQISYHGSKEGLESDDSEGENQELVQIDKGKCTWMTFDTCIHYVFTS